MALKILILRNKLESLVKERKSIDEEFSKLETREQELEKAIREAQTDEERSVCEQNIDKFENEKTAIEEKRDSLESEINDIEKQIEDAENKAPKENNQRKKENKMPEIRTTLGYRGMNFEERSAFVARAEIKDFLTRVRELKTENRGVSGAELAIPDVMLGIMREDISYYSKLIKYVTLRRISGKGRELVAGAVPEAVWTEMIANFNEEDIFFNQVEIDGYKVGGFVPVPNSTLDDASDVDLFNEVYVMLMQSIGKATDKAILYGTGRMPEGVLTRLAYTEQPSNWGTNAPAFTDLHTSNILKLDIKAETGATFFAHLAEALGVASPKYGTAGNVWVMNRKTHLDIMAKALSFNASGSLVSGINNTMPVIGGEIIELEFIPDYEIIGGYFSQYLMAERQGSTFKRSEHVRFLQDQTVFAGYARYDGKVVIGEGFVALNYNNTEVTTSATFAGDEANTDLVSLSGLTIGSANLFPIFSKDVTNYTCEVSAHSNKITATALKSDATVVIKNGDTVVENGKNATFTAGNNTLTIEVTNGHAVKRTYTVTVKDVTA